MDSNFSESSRAKEKIFIKWFRIILILLIVLYVLYKVIPSLSNLIILLIASILLAYILEPPVAYLERKNIPRTVSILIIYAVIAFLLILGINYVFPIITNEISSLTQKIENQQLETVMTDIQIFLKANFPFIDFEKLDIFEKFQEFLGNALTTFLNFLVSFISVFTTMIVLPVTTFLFLKDSRNIIHNFISIIPNRYFEFTLDLIHKINLQIGAYIRGVLTDALIIGILSIIGLAIINAKYFVIVGAIAGLCNIIPYFGPVAGAIPAIVISIMESGSFSKVPSIILVFVIVQLIDNVIVQPVVYGRRVNIHPLTVIFAILAGGKLWGIFGMLISIPFVATFKESIKQIIWGVKHYRL